MPHFDFFVIGAGSGGVSCARRAASYGAKVGIAEGRRAGGTCVNVGCVPKKIMFNTSFVKETIDTANHFGFSGLDSVKFNWGAIKETRDKYITRLNGIYNNNLANSEVTSYKDWASFTGPNSLKVGDEEITADHILIAVGGKPSRLNVPGEALPGVIDSDGFFELPEQPKKVAVIGSGYIATELAGVLNGLGSEVHMFVRSAEILRPFESVCKSLVIKSMKEAGVIFHTHSSPTQFTQDDEAVADHPLTGINSGKLTVHYAHTDAETKEVEKKELSGFDTVLVCIGRDPELTNLNLPAAGSVEMDGKHIKVDAFQNTDQPGVYAVGDACGKVELTPMAIAAGRRLADRLFGPPEWRNAKADYDDVPTVMFSHPPLGAIGLTEAAAIEKYGKDNIKCYTSTWVNLWYGQWQIDPPTKPKSVAKLVCLLPSERVVGLHVAGMGADEMLQGFAVAIRMGATKADFDRAVAIHPTAAEEIVTMPPWGLAPQDSASIYRQGDEDQTEKPKGKGCLGC